MKTLVFTLALILPHTALAATPTWCQGKVWPISRDLSIQELTPQLERMDRWEIVEFAWGELTTAQPKPMFAPLLQYLAGTENNADLRGYYKAMGYFTLGKQELPAAIAKWPKRQPYNGQGFTQEELCDLYVKAGGQVPAGARGPDSKKPASKAKKKG